jgi:hypothetical protein
VTSHHCSPARRRALGEAHGKLSRVLSRVRAKHSPAGYAPRARVVYIAARKYRYHVLSGHSGGLVARGVAIGGDDAEALGAELGENFRGAPDSTGRAGQGLPAVTTWLSRHEQAQVGIAGLGARLGGDHPAAKV